jgi:hypothetical protein
VTPAEERRAWAYALISRASTPPPAYGSPQWLALPDGPEKVAAVVLAAEKCLIDWESQKVLDDQVFAAERKAHRDAWDSQRGRFRPDPRIAVEIEREWQEWTRGEVA